MENLINSLLENYSFDSLILFYSLGCLFFIVMAGVLKENWYFTAFIFAYSLSVAILFWGAVAADQGSGFMVHIFSATCWSLTTLIIGEKVFNSGLTK